ncbi:septum formation initiator family protein [Patescibacteria group bacterium]|nr:septum formation initiator family protein [Patescibacteria group bacterium]
MPKRSKKNIKTKKLFLNFILFVLLFVFVITFSSFIKAAASNISENKAISELENKISEIEDKNIKIEEMINLYSYETSKEEVARKDLNLKKDGEKVVVISDNDFEIVFNKKLESEELNEINNLSKWFKYFFE